MVSLASDAHEAADAQPLLLERADHVGGRASLEGANLEQPVEELQIHLSRLNTLH